MKRCSILLVIRERQIKMAMKFYYTSTKMVKVKKTHNTKCWQGCGMTTLFVHCGWECKMVHLLWKPIWLFLIKIKHTLTIRPKNPTSRYSPKRNENIFHPKTCMWMFLIALLVLVKNWKHPNVHQLMNE